MKRYLLLLFLLPLGAFAQVPVVSGVFADGLSHSVVRLTFNVNQAYSNARVRYVASPGTCTGGTGGTVQLLEPAAYFTTGMRIVVGGLPPNTTLQLCPETTSDNVNWSSGVGITVTTLPLPAIHPALPIAPQAFSTAYPNTAGYTSVTVASDCSDYQSDVTIAVAAQLSHGTIINVPTTAPCGGTYTVPMAPDTTTFASTAVNTSNSEITLPSHGLTEGEGILFGYSYSAFPASASCIDGTGMTEQGLISGEEFYAHVIDPNTIQVYCNNPSGLPVNTGILMTFTTQGSGSNLYVRPWNDLALNWVIVRTATPDSQFSPAGTRTGPAWVSKMAVFTKPVSLIGLYSSVNVMLNVGANDPNVQTPVANMRFVGLEVTVADSPDSHTSSDPTPWTGLITSYPTAQNIIFDRCYIHLPGNPARVTEGWIWDGSNMGIVDSYLDNLIYWHANYTGLVAATPTNQSISIPTGEYWLQPGNVRTLSTPVTVNLSGTVTDNLFVYMDYSGTIQILLPPGESGTCSGGPCNVSNLSASQPIGSCNTSTAAFPHNSSGNLAAGPILCAALTAGLIASDVQTPAPLSSVYVTEGANFMIGGLGPGPYVFQDNYLEGAGLPWHHDDSGLDARIRSDYTYYRDTFLTLTSHMFQTASSDGFYYAVRHPLEWKSGPRKLLNGIIFDGSTQENTPLGDFVEFASDNGAGTSDLLLENSTFRHGPAGFWPPGTINSGEPLSQGPPAPRTEIVNNLFWDISPVYHSTCCNGDSSGKGWVLADGGTGNEDLIFDHNTVVFNNGALPSLWYMTDTLHEGVQITNNFLYLTSGDWGFQINTATYPSCTSEAGKTTADCVFTAPYRFDHNVLMSNASQSAVQAEWPTLINYIPSTPANYGAVGFFNYSSPTEFVNGNPQHLDFRLNSSGPYCSGCGSPASDGLDVGANIDVLEAAQGKVTLIGVPNSSITATSATVVFIAPDTLACPIDYSSSDPTLVNNFARATSAAGANSRGGNLTNTNITGLTSGTTYYYRVNCAVEQPTGKFRTR